MGIHTSCDSCYKPQESAETYTTLNTTSGSRLLPIKHVFVVCYTCIRSTEYFYFNFKNPSYVKPPTPEVEGEVKPAD